MGWDGVRERGWFEEIEAHPASLCGWVRSYVASYILAIICEIDNGYLGVPRTSNARRERNYNRAMHIA